jgi:signal transduction histidine kinase
MAAGTAGTPMIKFVYEAAERALAESRRAVAALSGDAHDAPPLMETVTRAAEEVAARAGVKVHVEADGAIQALTKVSDALMWLTRGAVNNAVRHGEASTVSIALTAPNGIIGLTVTDNGSGFDPSTVNHGYGLSGMRSRVEELGGVFAVSSVEGEGTVVQVDLPLPSPGQER